MVEVTQEDHARGCEGRNYACTCGFDDQQEARVAQAYQRGKIEGARLALEALTPFADCCDQIADDESDEEWAKFRLLVKDFRRARDAIRALSPAKIVGEG